MMKTALFTPGPGNTTNKVKSALCCDIGTRTGSMTALTKKLLTQIKDVAECGEDYEVIPLQGSGTFAVEGMLTSFACMQRHLLVAINGPYGERIARICAIHGIRHSVMRSSPLNPLDPEAIDKLLSENPEIDSLVLVHFETGIGVLNPLKAILSLAERYGVTVYADCMSSFGLLPIPFGTSLKAVVASSNKVLHGPPGLAFVVTHHSLLTAPVSPKTLALDLHAQHKEFLQSGMWRFTPPVQIVAALSCAIVEYFEKGGRNARFAHYALLTAIIESGLRKLNLHPLVEEKTPFITTYVMPDAMTEGDINRLNALLEEKAVIIYPAITGYGNGIRIGCCGDLTPEDAHKLVALFTAFFSRS